MRIKKFYTEYSPLIWAIFWAIMTILVILFWPRTKEIVAESAPPQDAVELPITIPERHKPRPITAPIPTPTPHPSFTPTPTPEATPTPPQYGFTEDDIYLMAVLLTGSKYVDGDGEFDFDYGRDDEYDQISLVLCVVMNRVRSERFPNTVAEVIWREGQFDPMTQWRDGLPQVSDISLQKVRGWCEAYDAYDPDVQSIPEDHLYFSGDGHDNHSR